MTRNKNFITIKLLFFPSIKDVCLPFLDVKISVWRQHYSHIFLLEYEVHIYRGFFFCLWWRIQYGGFFVVRSLFFFVHVISFHQVFKASISCYINNNNIKVHCTRDSQELYSEWRTPIYTYALYISERCIYLCNQHNFR